MNLFIKYQKNLKIFLIFFLAIFFISHFAKASVKEKIIDSRIVSTNLCIDSLLIALIGTQGIVAVSSIAGDQRYSLITNEVRNLKKVNFNAESIYALRPTLVLASNFSSAKTHLALTKLGIEIKLVKYAKSVKDVEDNLIYIGELLGVPKKATEIIASIRATEQKPVSSAKLDALQYSPNRYVNGRHSLISDIFRRSGFNRPSLLTLTPQGAFLSSELIIKSEPSLLLLDKNKTDPESKKNSHYHNAVYKLANQTAVIHVAQKQWSCGSPAIVDLINQLGKKYAQILRSKNAKK